MQDFVNNLERINTLGEQSRGFIWRMQDESGNAIYIIAFDDPRIIANLTVWRNAASLKDFIFKTEHAHFLKRKKEWFLRLPKCCGGFLKALFLPLKKGNALS